MNGVTLKKKKLWGCYGISTVWFWNRDCDSRCPVIHGAPWFTVPPLPLLFDLAVWLSLSSPFSRNAQQTNDNITLRYSGYSCLVILPFWVFLFLVTSYIVTSHGEQTYTKLHKTEYWYLVITNWHSSEAGVPQNVQSGFHRPSSMTYWHGQTFYEKNSILDILSVCVVDFFWYLFYYFFVLSDMV